MTERERKTALEAAEWLRKRALHYVDKGKYLSESEPYQLGWHREDVESLFVDASRYFQAAETMERNAREPND